MVELAAEERLSIDDLYGWLAENVQTIADADDADAKALADQAWIAVCEWQDSLWADSDVIRGKGTVDEVAKDAGVPVRSVRAVAAAMEAASRRPPALVTAG